jgi:hypothetical protein
MNLFPPWQHYDKWVLPALLLLGLAVRLDHIKIGLIDHHCFREGTEAMMARHFNRFGIHVQYPHVNGYGSFPVAFVNEFPLYPATVALFYRVFGEHVVLARLVTVAFSLATAALCYLLLRMYFSNSAPVWGTLLFLMSPLGSYVGRCVLRHPMAFFFMALAFYLWLLWVEKPNAWLWLGVWFSATITVLMNFANAYIGLPMLAALLIVRGWRGLADRRIWWLAAAILAPSFLWLKHALEFGAWFMTGPGGVKMRDPGRFARLDWLNAHFFSSLGEHLWAMLLTPLGCLLVAMGLCLYWRSKFAWLVRVWAATIFVYFGFDSYAVSVDVHDYYFVHALFPGCLAAGMAGGVLVDSARKWVPPSYPRCFKLAPALALFLLLVITIRKWDKPLKERFLVTEPGWIQNWVNAGHGVCEKTELDALVVVDQPVDALMYLCDRSGWLVGWRDLSEACLGSLIKAGADYLLITSTVFKDGSFDRYEFDDPEKGCPAAAWVRAHGKVIEDKLVYQIVDLAPERHEEERRKKAAAQRRPNT